MKETPPWSDRRDLRLRISIPFFLVERREEEEISGFTEKENE